MTQKAVSASKRGALLGAISAGALIPVASFAAPDKKAKPSPFDEASFRALLKQKYPQNPPPAHVRPSPIPGVIEMISGEEIIYTDATATYFFLNANFVHMGERRSLSQERLGEVLVANPKELAEAAKVSALKHVRGDGKRVMYVFSDPFCPFCKRLEAELVKLDDVTIYTFLTPRPDAMKLAETIWCTDKPQDSFEAYMIRGVNPEAKSCTSPSSQITASMQLGEKLNVRGTPTMFNQHGQRRSGWAQPDELNKFIDAAPVKVAAASKSSK